MEIRSFYTVVVVSIDMWESSIVDERHFGNLTDAENYKKNLPAGLKGLVCEVEVQEESKMTLYRVSKKDVRVLRDILDCAAVMYELSDDGELYLEADYNGILDAEGICYCRM